MIQILVDSACGWSFEEAQQQGLLFVPLTVHIAGQDFVEGVDITPDKFYQILVESGEFPKTSQPTPEAYLKQYLAAKAKGDDVLVIPLSSKLSGSYQSALLAKDMADYPGHIRLVDSLAITVGIQLLVKEAKAKIGTLSLEEIGLHLEALAKRIRMYAGFDTLNYLFKGGRLSRLSLTAGVLMHAKAICALKDGSVEAIGTALGTKNAMKFVVEASKKEPIDFAYGIYPFYTSDKTLGERFVNEYLTPAYPATPFSPLSQFDPVIGGHVGPLLYGVLYVRTPLEEAKRSHGDSPKGKSADEKQ